MEEEADSGGGGGPVMAAAGSPASRLRAAAPRAGRGRHPLAAAPRCTARERRWGWREGPWVALSVSDRPKFSPGAARAEGQRREPPAQGSAGARRDEAGRHSPAGWLSCSPVTAPIRGSDRPQTSRFPQRGEKIQEREGSAKEVFALLHVAWHKLCASRQHLPDPMALPRKK